MEPKAPTHEFTFSILLYHGYIEISEVYRGDLSKEVEEYKQQVEKAPLNSISNIAKQSHNTVI